MVHKILKKFDVSNFAFAFVHLTCKMLPLYLEKTKKSFFSKKLSLV